MKKGLFLLFAFLIVMLSCDNNVDMPQGAAAKAGFGRVAVTINGAAERTVFPAMTFAKYEYLFAKVTNGTPGTPEAQSPVEGHFSLELGDWQLTVKAYAKTGDIVPAATGTSSIFTVTGSAVAQATVHLSGNTATGEGKFVYAITYPAGAAISVFKLENLTTNAVINISASGARPLSGSRDVSSGYYFLTIQLTEGGGTGRTTGANEVVYIYDKLDSEYSKTFSADEFSHIHDWNTAYTTIAAATATTNGREAITCKRNSSHTKDPHTLYATGTQGLSFTLINGNTAYRVSRGTATGAIFIPAYYLYNGNYLPITEMPNNAFGGTPSNPNTTVTSVTFAAESPLASISNYAFYYCQNLTSINIPAGVTFIGDAAFGWSSSLTGITIPAGVTSIGQSTFNSCSSLTSIEIPAGVTSIGRHAFQGCTGLTSITIPAGVTSIGESAFSRCASLAGITVDTDNPNYVSQGGILYNKAKTTIVQVPAGISGNVTIPASVTSIGSYAFFGCTGLTSIEIPENVTSIGSYAFVDCTGLTGITIGENITFIGSEAFQGCTNLRNIIIDNDIITNTSSNNWGNRFPADNLSVTFKKNPGVYAFSYLFSDTRLTSVTIGEGVTSISILAFNNCSGLTSITAAANNPNYTSQEGILYNKTKTDIVIVPKGISGNVTIPESVTSIGSSAFRDCTGLTGINIHASITSIGSNAFQGCTGLTNIIIDNDIITITSSNNWGTIFPSGNYSVTFKKNPGNFAFSDCTRLTSVTISEGVTSIGNFAFDTCSGLTGSITIPTSVTSIGDYAFFNCSLTGSITIPASVTSIGDYAFYNSCANLTSITVAANNPSYASEAGILYNKAKTTLIQAPGRISGNFAIPASVTSISYGAFSNCSLTGIEIPASVTSIDYGAFYNCTGLRNIIIDTDQVTQYDDYPFSFITFPGTNIFTNNWGTIFPADNLSVTFKKNPGDYAFRYCTRLTSVTIAEGVTSIGSYAFSNCTGLTGITIPEGVTSIGSNAFSGCSSLTGITIPEGVTSSISDSVFSGCTGLRNIIIDNDTNRNWGNIFPATNLSVTFNKNIGNYAFSNCTRLTSVTIGEGVTSIGSTAFQGCTGLTGITIPANVMSIGSNAFSGCSSLRDIIIDTDKVTNTTTDNWGTRFPADNLSVTFNKNIGNYAFYFSSSNTRLTSITIAEGVTSIGSSAFYNCYNLTSVNIPEGVTSIDNSAFSGCSSLRNIIIDTDKVTNTTTNNWGTRFPADNLSVTFNKNIGNYAFYSSSANANSTRLTSVTIAEGVTSIGERAFYYCTGLTSVTCLPTTPPTLGTSVFTNAPTNLAIKVPSASVTAYRNATNWSSYSSRISAL